MGQNLTATSAFQMLIEASSEAIDHRERAEDAGLIQPWMNRNEGIAIVLAILVLKGCEQRFSPKIMTSLLLNYCHRDLAEAFVHFFCQISKRNGNEISPNELHSQHIDVVIDIGNCALNGKAVGWKESWGSFREPYASRWRAAFTLFQYPT